MDLSVGLRIDYRNQLLFNSLLLAQAHFIYF